MNLEVEALRWAPRGIIARIADILEKSQNSHYCTNIYYSRVRAHNSMNNGPHSNPGLARGPVRNEIPGHPGRFYCPGLVNSTISGVI